MTTGKTITGAVVRQRSAQEGEGQKGSGKNDQGKCLRERAGRQSGRQGDPVLPRFFQDSRKRKDTASFRRKRAVENTRWRVATRSSPFFLIRSRVAATS